MVGGTDMVIHTCNPGAARDLAVRRAELRWPSAIADHDGQVTHVYADAQALRSWARNGSTERNRDRLLSLWLTPGEITLTVDGPTTAAIASDVAQTIRANWAQFR